MDFLVSLGDVALLVDPYERILDLLAICVRGFVDADVNGERVFSGFILQTEDEWRLGDCFT